MDIRLIHELAKTHLKNTKKETAFKCLEELIEKSKDEDKFLLASLYNYLVPKEDKKAVGGMAWVQQAVATKDRYNKKRKISTEDGTGYTYVTDNYIVATDTQRLHIIEWDTSNMEHGYYNKKGEKVDLEYKFPRFEQVIPKEPRHSELLNVFDVKLIDGKAHIDTVQGTILIKRDYWEQATNGRSEITIKYTDNQSPVIIERSCTEYAVIMTLRK